MCLGNVKFVVYERKNTMPIKEFLFKRNTVTGTLKKKVNIFYFCF